MNEDVLESQSLLPRRGFKANEFGRVYCIEDCLVCNGNASLARQHTQNNPITWDVFMTAYFPFDLGAGLIEYISET